MKNLLTFNPVDESVDVGEYVEKLKNIIGKFELKNWNSEDILLLINNGLSTISEPSGKDSIDEFIRVLELVMKNDLIKCEKELIIKEFNLLFQEKTTETKIKEYEETLYSNQYIKNLEKENTKNHYLVENLESLIYQLQSIDIFYSIYSDKDGEQIKEHFHKDYKNLPLLISILIRATKIVYGESFELKITQLSAILLLLKKQKEKGLIVEMLSGEGKTICVAVIACILHKLGHNVDIVTSSDYLAKKDVNEQKKLFSLLGISVDHNIQDAYFGAKRCYLADIVYGTVYSYLRDILFDEYKNLNTLNKRKPGVLILDEIDSMFINEHNTVTIRSKKSFKDKFYVIFVIIWNRVNSSDEPNESTVFFYVKNILENGFPTGHEEVRFDFTKLELKFITSNITKWVHNAFLAKTFNENMQYGIENGKIIPLEYRCVGEFQINSQYSDGLQQFLEIKHQLELSPLNISTNYKSNLCFFQRYITLNESNIYGMTATLGSEDSQRFLSIVYKTDFISMPPLKPSRRISKQGLLVKDDFSDSWIHEVINSIDKETKVGKSVLVICENHRIVEHLNDRLTNCGFNDKNLFIATESYDGEKKTMKSKEVFLATSMASRYAEINLSKEVEIAGGLHVILTFLPINKRFEDQMFRRASRNGATCSTELIINFNDCISNFDQEEFKNLHKVLDMNDLKIYRDENYGKIIAKDLERAKKIQFQDDLFDRFCQLINKDLSIGEYESKNKSIFSFKFFGSTGRDSIEENWGYWLNSYDFNENIDTEEIKEDLEKLCKETSDLYNYQDKMIKNENYLNRNSNFLLWNKIIQGNLSEDDYSIQKYLQIVIKMSELSISLSSNQFVAFIHLAVAQFIMKKNGVEKIKTIFESANKNLENQISILCGFIQLSKLLKLKNVSYLDKKLLFYLNFRSILRKNIENMNKKNMKFTEYNMQIMRLFDDIKSDYNEQGLSYSFSLGFIEKHLLNSLYFFGAIKIALEIASKLRTPYTEDFEEIVVYENSINLYCSFIEEDFSFERIFMAKIVNHSLKITDFNHKISVRKYLRHCLVNSAKNKNCNFKLCMENQAEYLTRRIKSNYDNNFIHSSKIKDNYFNKETLRGFTVYIHKKLTEKILSLNCVQNFLFLQEKNQLPEKNLIKEIENCVSSIKFDFEEIIFNNPDSDYQLIADKILDVINAYVSRNFDNLKCRVELFNTDLKEPYKFENASKEFKDAISSLTDKITTAFVLKLKSIQYNELLNDLINHFVNEIFNNAFNQSNNFSYKYVLEDIEPILTEIMSNHSNNFLHLSPFDLENFEINEELRQKIKTKHICFVFNIKNLHWVCGSIVHQEKKLIVLCKDSKDTTGWKNSFEELIINSFKNDIIEFKYNQKIEQTDDLSSGIFALKNMKIIIKCLSKDRKTFVNEFENFSKFCSQADIAILRKEFAEYFVKGLFEQQKKNLIYRFQRDKIISYHTYELDKVRNCLKLKKNIDFYDKKFDIEIELEKQLVADYNYKYKFTFENKKFVLIDSNDFKDIFDLKKKIILSEIALLEDERRLLFLTTLQILNMEFLTKEAIDLIKENESLKYFTDL